MPDCLKIVLLLLCKGQMVYSVRERCGRQLATEASVDADIVSTVPDSATPAALGYSQQVGIGLVLTLFFVFCNLYLHSFTPLTFLLSKLTNVQLCDF